MKKQTIPTTLRPQLEQLENTLLTHHTLIWLLATDETFTGSYGWQICRGIMESNDRLLAHYEALCKQLTGTGLTDGHTITHTEAEDAN